LTLGEEEIVSAKSKNFIVVSIGEVGGYGYDEHSLPVLLRLVDSHAPDHRVYTHTGVVGHFFTSKKKLEIVRHLVSEAEALRAGDVRFADLKIGIAEGELIGEFDWLGRVKNGGVGLLGDANLEAVRAAKIPGAYKDKLNFIAQSLYEKTA